MTERSLLTATSAIIVFVGLVAPSFASAYVSASDVFGVNADITSGTIATPTDPSLLPPSPRHASDRVQQQQDYSALLRQNAQNAAFALQNPAPVAVSSSASSVATSQTSIFSNDYAYKMRMARMQSDGNGSPIIIINGNGASGGFEVRDGNGNTVLHSGAPMITASGPTDQVALAAIVVAAGSTLFFAWQLRKRHPALS